MRTFTRGDHVEMARALIQDLGPSPLTHDEGDFWRYDEEASLWRKLPLEAVEHRVTQYAGARIVEGDKSRPLKVSFGAVKGVGLLAANELRAREDRREFANAKAGIAFRNGFVVVEAGEVRLLPHADEHMVRHGFDFDYDPKLSHPRLDVFFEEIFGDCDEDERAARTMLFQEYVGVCLAGFATKLQRSLVMFGPGGNGKSAALKIARGVFPEGTVVSLPPQQWGERFQIARLVGALANFVDELPERDVTSSDTWKAVISGEPLHAERKNQNPFNFSPRAGHIFNTNSPIGSYDSSDGYWRRKLILPFTRNMERSPGHRLDAGEDVLALEHPAVVAWFLIGAARAQKQKGFTVSTQSAAIVKQWRLESDNVRLFLASRPDIDSAMASTFYEAFRSWCGGNGHVAMTSTKFGRRVMSIGIYDRKDTPQGRLYVRKPKSEWPMEGL